MENTDLGCIEGRVTQRSYVHACFRMACAASVHSESALTMATIQFSGPLPGWETGLWLVTEATGFCGAPACVVLDVAAEDDATDAGCTGST